MQVQSVTETDNKAAFSLIYFHRNSPLGETMNLIDLYLGDFCPCEKQI